MFRVAILLLGLLPIMVSAAEIYKWVDDMGVTHYGDQPHQGAEKIELPETQPVPSSRASSNLGGSQQNDVADDKGYKSFAIVQPENNQTIRDNAGSVSVAFIVNPSLRAGHKIRVSLDGHRLKDGTAIRFSLQGVDRGTHTLSAAIVDANGATVISAGSISFHLRKHFISHKNNKPESSDGVVGAGL
ncbi:hypothetical protein MNBD_GAMMA26-199 [hydrothermal vent metagenome]|uniref:DUF4124 domain-containing protein n=1 Tax=hydrothermal vent metagenome TaxID=652676 RepID=A0A3B1B857_9ZZZZ